MLLTYLSNHGYVFIFYFQSAHVILRDAMSVEEFLASACSRKNLNPMEHFVRVKKRRDMEDHNYFVPHRTDLIETYVSKSIILYLYLYTVVSLNHKRCFNLSRSLNKRNIPHL
jgi:hypothetical protein